MEDGKVRWTPEQTEAFTRYMCHDTQQYGVIFYDAALRITGWNAGAHYITGWTMAETLGQPTGMLFVPEDRERKLDVHEADAARVVGVNEDERWHLRKDGSRFWSSGVSVVLTSGAEAPSMYMKVFRDVTHLRARMKYLENMLQDSAAERQDKNVFIGTIAHEMRNPLSPLKLAVQLIKAGARKPDDGARHAHALRVMERQIGFLERLIEDLVDLTRVQAGKLNVAYETVVLQDCLLEAIESCQAGAEAKGIALRRILPSVPIRIEVDPNRLQQVIVNLLGNAVKYTRHGGNIWVSATVDQTHFVCNVKDDGQGIDADLLPRIFDIFTQADDRQAARGDGLGIGLAVVKEIVSRHQGTIEVRSEGPGKGSEFMIRIPQRRPHGAEREPLPPPAP